MKIMFGASGMLYGGTSYGKKVRDAPSMVREFRVEGETLRSYILEGGMKVPKKTMICNVGNFTIHMYWTVEQAVASLASSKA